MTERITAGGLQVAKVLYDFVNDTALPAAGIEDKDAFWQGFGDIVEKFTPRNVELLAKRDELQAKLDDWYRENPGQQDMDSYVAFLKEIGYLVEDPGEFQVTTANVDTEITSTAGPQDR
ncbi:MAG: malate synthase G, partial [Corynebacterium sp.]|nr:malate synthase G [Corynebacterium sp.]